MEAFQLSQYELYSSRVKDFEVRGRQAHPRAQGGDYAKTFNTTGWPLLGKYTAAKMKGSQVPAYTPSCIPVMLSCSHYASPGRGRGDRDAKGYTCGGCSVKQDRQGRVLTLALGIVAIT